MHRGIITCILASILSTVGAQDTTIHVGSDSNGKQMLAFSPSSVNVVKGSVVTFVFDGIPGNHTVAQSAFAKPCEPLAGGFDSGFIFVPPTTDAASSFPTFNLTIEDDTKPIWFYCAQPNPAPHCLAGMVGAINAPATGNTFSSYAAVAAAASSLVAPIPALSGVNAFATAPPGPLTGSFSGAAVPTGTLLIPIGTPPASLSSGAASSSSSRSTTSFSDTGSSLASGTSSISASGSPTDHSVCPTSGTDVRGLLAFFTAALAFGLAVNIAGIIWLFRIRRESRRGNTTRRAHKISPFV